jgi:MinD-like ATPase involved in chromosome partitioning or flagellar assembly
MPHMVRLSMRSGAPLKRKQVYPGSIVDGRPVRDSLMVRLRSRLQSALVSSGEREEGDVERLLRSAPGVTRANTVAVASPKGGVGKTTSAFLVGNLLASHQKLRVVAVDANPDFGTLADLAPDTKRSERSLSDLLADLDGLSTAAQLRPYVSPVPSGLHLLAAPRDAQAMAAVTPEQYGRLLAFLSMFYEVVVLDLGTGLTAPLARFVLDRADQLVLVTTPEWVTAQLVLAALDHVEHERTTVLLNKASARVPLDHQMLEERFRHERLHRSIVLPYDEQLQVMLDTGTYSIEALPRRVRLPVKQLALAVSEQLV